MPRIQYKFFTLALGCLIFTTNLQAQRQFDVYEASISQIQTALEQGEVSSVQLTQMYLDRIQAYDKQGPRLNSIVRVNPVALVRAAALDAERARTGSRGPLHGVPLLIKDNYNTVDMPTTGGSVALADFIPSDNAAQLDKLLAAGAIILAKTNLHEYAYGITSIGSLIGQTRNPYDPRRVPGGSSGGTGAAVAASFAAAGFGSDTCGSIRIPSAFNNLIGLRPSKGLSSIYGIQPLSHSQDVAGPLARSAEDLAIILDVVTGIDPRDEATLILESVTMPRFVERLQSAQLEALRLGRLQNYFEDTDSAISSAIEDVLAWYEEQGAEIVDIEIPQLSDLIRRSGLIGHEFERDIDEYFESFSADSSLNLDSIVAAGLYHEAVDGVLSRSSASTFDETAYQQAVEVRSELRAAIEAVLVAEDLDALVYPTIRRTQVFTGESQAGSNCSLSANSGLPALTMPAGFTANGLPVGLELLGGFLQDAELLAIASAHENEESLRQAPSTTPALVQGLAPASRAIDIQFNRSGVEINASFNLDVSSNRFSYTLEAQHDGGQALSAVTLVIDRDGNGEADDPIVLNLLPPQLSAASGEHFMSAEFREAFEQRRLFLKVFAAPFSRTGASQLIE